MPILKVNLLEQRVAKYVGLRVCIGVALTTQFSIVCSNWVTNGGTSTGLTYTYESGFRNGTLYAQFYSGTDGTCSQVMLPLGDSTDSFILRIQASVVDAVGESTTVNLDVKVSPSNRQLTPIYFNIKLLQRCI